MTVTHIHTPNAPAPAGHYAQATLARGMLCISGQLPVRPDGSRCDVADFEMQARQALANLLAILAAAGGTPADLQKVTAYIQGVDHWPALNRIYAEMLGTARPARAIVPVPELHYGFLVEVDAIALIADAKKD
jgi:2-iminobutanoate/2-iminopropanoate deaminase